MENNNINDPSSEAELYNTLVSFTEKINKISQVYFDNNDQIQESLQQLNIYCDVYQEYIKKLMADPAKLIQLQASYWHRLSKFLARFFIVLAG